jgi:UDP-N-acetylglucosamine--N-acetylmuramyl-(pentapeptide) pyrophosphoryl-undecaprenol N-acetylglucosamine transferase
MFKKPISNKILLAAGGTGGHIFPAVALASELKGEGYEVHFATDKRGMAFSSHFADWETHSLVAATVYGGGMFALPLRVLRLTYSLLQALFLILRLRPAAVVGFGGYPSFAPSLIAILLRTPVLVHEQNAVFGRANRMLARLGAYVATSFKDTANLPKRARRRTRRTGNPLRSSVINETTGGYRFLSTARPFDLLIFGGSQGAQVFNKVVPEALSRLSAPLRKRLRVTHQSRAADMTELLEVYNRAGIYAEIRDFYNDMPRRIRRAHLVVSRAGASTVSELAAIGAPSILVPLPGALDADQLNNTRELASKGGCWVMPQSLFLAGRLAAKIEALMENPERLLEASEAARSVRVLDAARKLSRYAICLAHRKPIQLEASAYSSAFGDTKSAQAGNGA